MSTKAARDNRQAKSLSVPIFISIMQGSLAIRSNLFSLILAYILLEFENGPPNSTVNASSSVQLDCVTASVTLVTFQPQYAIF